LAAATAAAAALSRAALVASTAATAASLAALAPVITPCLIDERHGLLSMASLIAVATSTALS
jgi:hypothetical protein